MNIVAQTLLKATDASDYAARRLAQLHEAAALTPPGFAVLINEAAIRAKLIAYYERHRARPN
jgi:hypothetical protein